MIYMDVLLFFCCIGRHRKIYMWTKEDVCIQINIYIYYVNMYKYNTNRTYRL